MSHEDYWLKKLAGTIEKKNFPFDHKAPVMDERRIERESGKFPDEVYTRLLKKCENSDLRLYKLLVSGVGLLLQKYTYGGDGDFIIGGPVRRREVEPFNTALALKISSDKNATFNEFFLQVGQVIDEAYDHEDYPISALLWQLNLLSSDDEFPLFDVTVSLENLHDKDYLQDINTNMKFSFLSIDQSIEGTLEYNAVVYEKTTIKRIFHHLANLLRVALTDINTRLIDIDILSAEDKQQLLVDFNDTRTDYPWDKTVHGVFAEQAAKGPDSTAAIYQDSYLSYKELDRKADQVAAFLQQKGVIHDEPVGIMADHSLEMVIGILGILKVGGAYLPINFNYPEERKRYILQNGNIRVLLTTSNETSNYGPEVISLYFKGIYLCNRDSKHIGVNSWGHEAAYILFTSGSSGKPKGVIVEHRGVIRLVKNTDYLRFENEIRFGQIGALEFDVSTYEIWGSLLNGLTLCIAHKDDILSPGNLKKTLLKYDVGTICIASPIFNQLLDADSSIFFGLAYLLTGGDVLSPAHINRIRSVCPKVTLLNCYGPTENTTFSTAYTIDRNYEENIPIGIPIANSTCYIVDENLRLLPLGAPGELVAGGDGVARGYLNDPELTAEKFDQDLWDYKDDQDKGGALRANLNAFGDGEAHHSSFIIHHSILYRTGDLARWLPDGNIEFLGRIDQQVKIRGFRIELGEIEHRLLKIDQIKEAVVVDLKDAAGEKYLCAYLTAAVELDITGAREKLAKLLPEYMIPSYFVQVEKIPLNINGKIDRKKLPDPRTIQRSRDYIAPRDKTEKKLAENWAAVLHMNESLIGVDDDFFKMGGHSLKAAVLAAAIHKTFNVKLSIRQVFAYPTLGKQAEYIKGAEKVRFAAIRPAPAKEYYRLSSAQKRMYFMTQLDKNSTLYNEQLMEVYYELTDKEKLEQAFKKLIQRHESLRTSFHQVEGEAVQKIHDYPGVEDEFKIEYYESAEDGMISSPQEGKEWTRVTGLPFQDVVEQFVQPFDLSIPPLIRVGLIKIMETHQVLMVDIHHIVFDGLSLVIMLEELRKLYDGEELAPISIQYKDFAEWSRQDEQIKEIEKQENFWLREFSGEIPRLNLPLDFPRPAKMTFDGDTLTSELNAERVQNIYRAAQINGATLFMVLLAVYDILLAKLSGQEEIIVGTVTAGRGHADLQKIIGMFVNTLALRNFPTGRKTFREFLAELKEKTLAAFDNQDYQFDQLVGKVGPRQDAGRNPLFDSAFELENESDHKEFLLETLMLNKANPYDFKVKKAKFELALIAVESHEGLLLKLEYNSQLFKKETVERFLGYYKKLLVSICSNSEQKIAEIEMIPREEKRKLLCEFNSMEWDCPKTRAIHTLFEEQAEKTPDHIAVVGRGRTLFRPGTDNNIPMAITYRELNKKAGQISWRLRNEGFNPGDIAAVMVEPSQEMIIGLMAILKAGGAFLPMKDGTPIDRINYMLLESSARFLLTRPPLAQGVTFKGAHIYLDDEGLYNAGQWDTGPVITPCDSAYVIYTSGSTGKPKGVMVEHRGLVNLCCWHNRYFQVTAKDRATKYAGFGFDASVWEIFPYMIIGASLYIVPEEIKLDVRELNRFYEYNGITVGFLPTQVAEQFMIFPNNSLRTLQVGGDKLKMFIKRDYRLVNCYGPTENTVCATAYPVTESSDNIPIGKPIANNQIYIVDKNDYVQPVGVPGELCIGGDSLARGYLNNPELTCEKFDRDLWDYKDDHDKGGALRADFHHSSFIIHHSILYRTGDLARWLDDGNIEFLGRIDSQVKIRGFRIELGEIENQLLHCEKVKEAVVIAREDVAGQKYLCAYIVPIGPPNIEAIKGALLKNLPDYMIPSFFIQLEQIPLTPNGKIDVRALPAPEAVGAAAYEAPTDEIEEILAQTWREVLVFEKIGAHDNFFEIGGDSIKTILISSKLFKWGLTVNVHDFFLYPTIRGLAKNIKKIEHSIHQGIVAGKVPLTPIQEWFFEQPIPDRGHFNQSILLSREKGFNEDYIKKVFTKIVSHHDALRMVYKIENNAVMQENRGSEGNLFDLVSLPLKSTENEAVLAEIKEEAERIQRSIDLQNGPLVKLGLFKGTGSDHLLIVIHHLVTDGVSWRILLEDFEIGYAQAEKETGIKFQAKSDSFQFWAQKLEEYAGSNSLLREIPYWQAIPGTGIKPLPVDHEIQAEQRAFENNEIVPMLLDEEKTQQLLTGTNWAYNTEINDILLTALGLAVKQWAGVAKVMLNLEGHGRELIYNDIDISRTIGWFSTQYPVLLDMEKADDISFTVKNTKETLRGIPKKGIGYGVLQYLTPRGKKESPRFTHAPEILFNYLGRFGENSYNIIDRVSEISDPRTGASVAPSYKVNHKIDIEGVTKDGRLHIYIFYNRCEYEKETIEKFARLLQTNLEKVIDHCLARQQKEATPSDLGCNKISIVDLERITGDIQNHIGKDMEIQLIYPLSPMQSGMLFHWLKDKQSPAYFEQTEISFRGDIRPLLFEEALNTIVARYDVLRTIFAYEGLVEPLQIVLKERKTHLQYEDISRLNEADREKYLEGVREKDRERGFDLFKDHLTRFSLFKTGDLAHVLMWTFHHTLMDGWCLGIIRRELTRIYRLLEKGEPVTAAAALEPTPPPYVEYIRWLEKQDKEEGLRFWEQYLEGYEEPAGLPRMGKAAKNHEYQKAEYHFTIAQELMTGMNRLAGEHQATVNTFFQAVWGVLLQKYNNRDDVVFGAIVSGRPEEITGVERMVGLFINMTPIRVKNLENQDFALLLEKLQVESLGLKKYEYLPVAEIQARSRLKADLIDHIIVFENYLHEAATEAEKGLVAVDIKAFEQTNYDFNIIVLPWDGLHVHFSYNALVYDRDIIENISRHFEKTISQVVDTPHIILRDIDILSETEKEKVLFEFNNTKTDYPFDKTIHRLFEEQVEKTPGNTALILHEDKLTYREFNEKANQLAKRLREKGVRPDQFVGLMIERSMEMIIGMMAILKAGGAYLPIDPDYPADRVRFLVADSNIKLLLTQEQYLETSAFGSEALNLQDKSLYQGGSRNLDNVNISRDIAYSIYTSGSTGKPKGVAVEHRSVINLAYSQKAIFEIVETDNILQFSSISFDASVEQIYICLFSGAALVLVDKETLLDMRIFEKLIDDNALAHINGVPLFLSSIPVKKYKNLKRMIAGGDICPLKLVKEWTKYCDFYNQYGPTETTVTAIKFLVKKGEGQELTNLPIGKALNNTYLYLLDRNMRPVPIGVPGELFIGGDGLARGYLNLPELTCEKFIVSPFPRFLASPLPRFPLYRTGDLARWLMDGNIEFLGRIDQQVKIRGFRIELGEIENRLTGLGKIKDAVVIAREDALGQKYLCAYVVSDEIINIESLKSTLSKYLPGYMIPSYFVPIEKLPLTPSGKLDRKALPVPGVISSKEFITPSDEIEEILADVWSEVLGIKRIGIHDDFFDIGGDSIKIILISARLQKRGLSVNINDFFSHSTIKRLAKHVKKIERVIDQAEVSGDVELTPIHRWFFEKDLKTVHHFNHFVMQHSIARFNEENLKKVFTKIAAHHDALRMVYDIDRDRVIQRNRGTDNEKLFDFEIIDLRDKADFHKEIEREANKIQQGMDLKIGPLVKICLFRTVKGDYLMISIHHAVVDGVSWRILIEDLEIGYQQSEKGEEIKFQAKTHSFKYWASKLKEYADSPLALSELNYWKGIEETEIKKLPRDHHAAKETKKYKNLEVVTIRFNKEETEKLLKEVNWPYNTEINDILLTSLGLATWEWSGNEKILINLEGHGREAIIKGIDISRTVGWFTSQYPVLLDMKPLVTAESEQLGMQIRHVKENLRRIPNRGIGYGILRYLTSPEKKEAASFKLQPEISFNYLGQLDNTAIDSEKKFQPNFTDSINPEFDEEYILNINGFAGNEGLIFYIAYNKYEYDRCSIEKFSDCYKSNLLKIINHCVEKKKEISALGMTARDYFIKKDSDKYQEQINAEEWQDLTTKNDYRHIMLTGATGFLGAHLVPELLNNIDATLYLPVRGATQEDAEERLKRKMEYYFGKDFFNAQRARIVVIRSNFREEQLGIDRAHYKELCEIVDAVVHPAANVKHHGLYEDLYEDNVKGTENLLEFALTGKKKDFHYISTLSVAFGNIPGIEYYLFTEYCHDVGQQIDQIYVRSKLEAEKRVLAYREKGLNTSIYRVGNLIAHSETGKFQENIEDDYFYAILRGVLKLEMLSDYMKQMVFDMSFINYTARATVLFLTKKYLKNETYHIINTNEFTMAEMAVFLRALGFKLNDVKDIEVEGYLSQFDGNNEYEKIIERLKLHSGVFEEKSGTQSIYKIDRTVLLLNKLGFQWPEATKAHIDKMIAHCKEVGFI